jgi:hypothetical protein
MPSLGPNPPALGMGPAISRPIVEPYGANPVGHRPLCTGRDLSFHVPRRAEDVVFTFGGLISALRYFAALTEEFSLIRFPQHSGRSGSFERSHTPPRASISKTALAIRRPRMFTAVISSDRAAFCAVITSR